MTLKRVLLATVLVLAYGAAFAADTVGLVSSKKLMFQHPKFDEVTKLIIILTRPLEGNLAQITANERDPERRRIIAKYSQRVTEFAEYDRAISAEQDQGKKRELLEERQKKVSDLEAGLMTPIYDDCMRAVQSVMTLRKITILLEEGSVYHGGTDITEEVIRQLRRSAIE